MRHLFLTLCMLIAFSSCAKKNTAGEQQINESESGQEVGKTLVLFYSFSGNVRDIVVDLQTQIECDVREITPAQKGLDYAANNYAIGSELIGTIKNYPNDANSYPAIDDLEIDLTGYSNIIVATPLWWSQMAAPMQTYLFNHGSQMANKNICLIASSHSSGIAGVESDCKRLVPDGKHTKSLWINADNHIMRQSLLSDWIKSISLTR